MHWIFQVYLLPPLPNPLPKKEKPKQNKQKKTLKGRDL